jgi:Lon-like ATP-dependent protease
MDQVHPVGVFAQITSVFGSTETGKTGEGGENKPETLTAVLYPHRRIRIDDLVTQAPAPQGETVPIATVVEEVQKQESEEDVPSFEKEVPSVAEVREELGTVSPSRSEETTEETKGEIWRYSP